MQFKQYQSSYQKEILDLIKRSDNTNRTEDTWVQNNMEAVLAYDGEHLVGAIPLEPRRFNLGQGELLPLLWVSAAHVDSEYRGKGLGSILDKSIDSFYQEKFDAVFVYREDENSSAYRWYERNEYIRLESIIALKMKVNSNLKPVSPGVSFISSTGEVLSLEEDLVKSYQNNYGEFGGGPLRELGFYKRRLESNYYKDSYKYSAVILRDDEGVKGHALLGLTSIRDGVKRFDILELCVSRNYEDFAGIIDCILYEAQNLSLEEVRIQISGSDPSLINLFERGFEYRWRTNLMGRFFNPIEKFEMKFSGVQAFTPNRPYNIELANPLKQQVFMLDETLTRLLTYRDDFSEMLEAGKVSLLNYKEQSLKETKKKLTQRKWLFHHLDYV